jgi:hypothetical protein
MTEAAEKKKPGPKPQYGEPMKRRPINLTDAQWAKVQANGGVQWVRNLITKAKDGRK